MRTVHHCGDGHRLQDITPAQHRASRMRCCALKRGRTLGDLGLAAKHEILTLYKLLN